MRRFVILGLTVVLAVVAVVVLRDGDDRYAVVMRLKNAAGLRDGSPVVVGGVPIGKVRLQATARDVEVELRLDHDRGPVGRDARAEIVAQNVLGQKQVRLTVGSSRRDPAPDGYVIPARQTRTATDLDQLLGTLDARTRTRLAIVLNELGTAFTGRRTDFKTLVGVLAPALESGQDLLGQLTADNRRIGGLVDNADAFVSALTASRRQVADGLDAVGRATETVAARRAELRDALAKAPVALRTGRGFLTELRRATGPLRTAATRLTATAPALRTTLDRLEPFTRDAAPALRAASEDSAPALLALARDSPGDLRALQPALTNADRLVRDEVPAAGDALGGTIDNLTAVLENWSRAIQFRDGVSHVFRAELSVTPDTLSRLVGRLTSELGGAGSKVKQAASAGGRAGGGHEPSRSRPAVKAPSPSVAAPPATTTPAPAAPAPGRPSASPLPILDQIPQLLDRLLGRP